MSDSADSLTPPAANLDVNPHELRQAQRALTNLLPTSPSSPAANAFQHSDSAVALLQSLVAFYHQERMWVYRTRAHLELTLDAMPSPASPAASSLQTPDSASTPITPIKQEPVSPASPSASTSTSASASPAPMSKWMRRKMSYGLRLEGIRPVMSGGISKKRSAASAATAAATARPGRTRTGVHLLEQFECMMQARMESCERISNMVRNANHVPPSRHVS